MRDQRAHNQPEPLQSGRDTESRRFDGGEAWHSGTVPVAEDLSPPTSVRRRPSPQTELEAAFFRALTATSVAFAAVGASGVSLYWSEGAQDLLGYTAAEIVGQSLELTLPSLARALDAHRDDLRAGRSFTSSVEAPQKSGGTTHLTVRVVPALSEQGDMLATLVAFASDRAAAASTDPKIVGPDLIHDLGNVLATIQIYGAFLENASNLPQQSADLQVAMTAARQGVALLDALAGSKHATAAPSQNGGVIDVKELIRHLDERLRQAVGAGIEVSIQLPLGPLPVRAPPEQLEQLVIIIAHNARDAMGGVGALQLTLRNTTIGPSHPFAADVPLGTHAVISLRDTGKGMTAETRGRIFEPFFTTKPRGEGRGLGLVVANDIAARLHGAIRVESEPGQGAEFQVFLPLVLESDLVSADATTLLGAPSPVTVLVIEDDAELRLGLRRILEGEGMQVLEAADALEAGEVAARYPHPIKVLLADMTLPRADGRDALTRVRRFRPDIPALFISGKLDRSRPLPDNAEFLRKPFATPELLTTLSRLLRAAPAHSGQLVSSNAVVLIVDDDEELRDAFARVVEECEFKALRAKSALHALQALDQQHVDVVICDQFMPGMDGVHLLELVRERFPKCIRILFTAHPSSDVVLEAVNRGGVHKVLVKTMHAVAIRDEIENAVLMSDRFRPTSP